MEISNNSSPDPVQHQALASIPDEALLVPAMDQVSCGMDENTVILNIKDGEYYELDPVGTQAWNLLQETIVFGRLVERMLEEYEVGEAQLREDLAELVAKLAQKGLVEIHGPQAA